FGWEQLLPDLPDAAHGQHGGRLVDLRVLLAHRVPDALDGFGRLERTDPQVDHHFLDLVGGDHPGGAAAVAVAVVALGYVVVGLERADQQVDHHVLDLVGGDHPGGAAAVAVAVVRLGNVVAVLLAGGLLAVGDVVLATVGAVHQATQQRVGLVPSLGLAHALV